MLRFLTAGESHGPAQAAILEGIPQGLSLTVDDIQQELEKRRGGAGRGGRGKIESDKVEILAGVRFGKTLGSPIALLLKNRDFNNWREQMQVEPQNSWDITRKVTNPRPGHADLAGILKYGFDDVRNVLERASARETVMRVAVGAVCKRFLQEFNIEIASHTIQIAKIKYHASNKDFNKIKNVYKTDPLIHCLDKKISQKMAQAILEAQKNKDTLGGVIEIIAHNIPAGLGSYVHWDKRLDGRLAQALMSIPSVKAVEIGEGINNSRKYGSQVHDEIYYDKKNSKYFRQTNRAGGIEGGISNGEDIIVRVFFKPLSTLRKAKQTVDIHTKKPTQALIERSDSCVVPRAGVISEAMTAYILADCMLEKFAGDSLKEIKRNFNSFLKYLK